MIQIIKKELAFFYLIILASTGCSVPANYYLQNLSNQNCRITLVSSEPLMGKVFSISYDSLIEDRNLAYETFKHLSKIISVQASENNLIFEIPKKSTVYIGPGSNFNPYFKQLIIFRANSADTLNLYSKEKLKSRGAFKYAVWYDIN